MTQHVDLDFLWILAGAFLTPFVVIPILILVVRQVRKVAESRPKTEEDINLYRVKTFSKKSAFFRTSISTRLGWLSPSKVQGYVLHSDFGKKWLYFQMVLTIGAIINVNLLEMLNCASISS